MIRPPTVGPPDGRVIPRFAGPDTFARLPTLSSVEGAEVAVVGVPFDSGTSYRPGARFGPAAVRAASKTLRPYHPGLGVEPWAVMQVADAGDLAANPFSIQEAIAAIEAGASTLLGRARRLLDTWDTYFGEPYTHGTPFRRAVEEGLLEMHRSVHVGIRSPLYARSDLGDDAALGFSIVSAAEVAREGVDAAVERIRERVRDRPVYLSIDIDVLDPAHAPGTGTPEPGGLTTREMQMILRGLAGSNLVGADVVEVAPAYDHAELTALAGAHLAYEILALMALTAGGSGGEQLASQ
jgi:agmatinase